MFVVGVFFWVVLGFLNYFFAFVFLGFFGEILLKENYKILSNENMLYIWAVSF